MAGGWEKQRHKVQLSVYREEARARREDREGNAKKKEQNQPRLVVADDDRPSAACHERDVPFGVS